MTTLSVIIPTYNERANIPILMQRLSVALAGIDFEVVVVDDNSKDRTWEEVDILHEQDARIRGIRRVGRKGLSSAVIEGVLSSHAEFIAVIDGDLQHDETLLPLMLKAAQQSADVVIGSRYLAAGSMDGWDKKRIAMSQMATWVTLRVVRHELSDPLSGFFLMRKKIFTDCVENLVGEGFKILLDVLSNYKSGSITIKELPFTFRSRQHGESKLSASTVIYLFKFFLIKTFTRKTVAK